MRLFVGVPLPGGVQAAVAAHADAMRRELPPARWVEAGRLHLTLLFIGEADPALVEPLTAALRRAVAPRVRLDARVGGGGTFPPRREARVAWVGLHAAGDLDGLAAAVRSAVAGLLPEAVERRAFHPHVTVARCRPAWPRRAAARWAESVPPTLGEPFAVASAALLESRTDGERPRYETLAALPLGGAP